MSRLDRSFVWLILLILDRSAANCQVLGRVAVDQFDGRLAEFNRAALKQGKTIWPNPSKGRSGTRVLISFEPRSAGITIVTESSFGIDRLSKIGRQVADQFSIHNADLSISEGEEVALVDLNLRRSVQRSFLRSEFELDISGLSAILGVAHFQQPMMLAIDAQGATSTWLDSQGRTLQIDDYWFYAADSFPPSTRLRFEAKPTLRAVPGLVAIAALCVGALVLPYRALKTTGTRMAGRVSTYGSSKAEDKPAERNAPSQSQVLTLITLAAILLVLCGSEVQRMMRESMIVLRLLAPISVIHLIVVVIGMAGGSAIAGVIRRSAQLPSETPVGHVVREGGGVDDRFHVH